jgi:tetratricopeptide (TPR) repeat protein
LQAELAYTARDYAAAIAAYNRVLLFDPDAWDLIYARGVVLADAGHTAAALRDFRAVLAAQPDNIDALNALGFTLADANRDLPEARSLLARALAARPGNAAIIDSWGWLQYRLGDYQLAISTLRKAWQLDRSAEIGAHLARALQAGGQHLQARRVLAQALKLDPRSRAAQAARREIGT